MTATDEFIPVERRHHYGRVMAFIDEVLKPDPEVWHIYPHKVKQPQYMAVAYASRYPGTEWALDKKGRLGARWIGVDSITELT